MKLPILLLLLASVLTPGLSQTEPHRILTTATVKEAIVYTENAMITAQQQLELKKGINEVVVEKMSQYIDKNTVQVFAGAELNILSVGYQTSELNAAFIAKQTQLLLDSIQILEQANSRLRNQIQLYQSEEDILKANYSVAGSQSGLNVAELEKLIVMSQRRLGDVLAKKLAQEELLKQNMRRIERLRTQSQQAKSGSERSGEVTIVLDCAKAGRYALLLSYIVQNCGWTPQYDVRLKNLDSPLQVYAKANVYQNTGEAWNSIKIQLSTGNARRSGIKPNLAPWVVSPTPIRYKTNTKYRYKLGNDDVVTGARSEQRVLSAVEIAAAPSSRSTPSFSVVESATNALFEVAQPYSIASNGEDHIIDVKVYELPASFLYAAVPKLEKDAFLMAQVVDWDYSELLPGDAQVYFEGRYVGKTFFDTREVQDTLSFSLGADNQMSIKRSQTRNYLEHVALGNARKLNRSVEIEVRNKRKQSAEIIIEEQIPISQTEQIEARLVEAKNAEYNKTTGMLKWRLKLAPGESQKLSFSYYVRYPKSMRIGNM